VPSEVENFGCTPSIEHAKTLAGDAKPPRWNRDIAKLRIQKSPHIKYKYCMCGRGGLKVRGGRAVSFLERSHTRTVLAKNEL